MIILLAALQDIPDQLYEAAAIDGATGSQAFWRISLPAEAGLAFVVTIMIIASFNLFGQPFLHDRGKPSRSRRWRLDRTDMYRIYITGFAGWLTRVAQLLWAFSSR